jgi:hypothetical protein
VAQQKQYEAGHTAGLRLLRVAASARQEHGPDTMGALYLACGTHIFDSPPGSTAADAQAIATACLTEPGMVRYPTRQAFSDMVADPDYQQVTHLRTEASARQCCKRRSPGRAERHQPLTGPATRHTRQVRRSRNWAVSTSKRASGTGSGSEALVRASIRWTCST